MACFWAADHQPQTTITVDFDWKSGVAAKDWTNVAKKGSIDVSLSFRVFTFVSSINVWHTGIHGGNEFLVAHLNGKKGSSS